MDACMNVDKVPAGSALNKGLRTMNVGCSGKRPADRGTARDDELAARF